MKHINIREGGSRRRCRNWKKQSVNSAKRSKNITKRCNALLLRLQIIKIDN
jgi:hypothetical protein